MILMNWLSCPPLLRFLIPEQIADDGAYYSFINGVYFPVLKKSEIDIQVPFP